MREYIARSKERARLLRLEVYALYLAYRDSRVPWIARVFAACVVGYTLSPIDLIPDFIPVIGYLDDLVLIPLGIKMALSMIPAIVMNESREKAREIIRQGKPVNQIAGFVIIAIWVSLAVLGISLMARALRPGR